MPRRAQLDAPGNLHHVIDYEQKDNFPHFYLHNYIYHKLFHNCLCSNPDR